MVWEQQYISPPIQIVLIFALSHIHIHFEQTLYTL